MQKIWSLNKQTKRKLYTKPEVSFPGAMESGYCCNEKFYIWKSELIFQSDKNNNLFLFSLHATQSNIYGGAFLRKNLTAKSRELFLQKRSTIDFWLGSKFGS